MNQPELTISEHLIFENHKVGVACSGGLDSMSLLHALSKCYSKVFVLHVNYGLRGSDSEQDELLVRNSCQELGFPCFVYRLSSKEIADLKKSNLQAKARNIRFSFFEKIAEQESLEYIYVAHHQQDQLETFYLRIFRKAGIRGLKGMAEVQGKFVRPWLNESKNTIKAYAQTHQVVWREDLSNLSNDYLRNKLRNEMIPMLSEQIPSLEESVGIIMAAFRDTYNYLLVEHGETLKSMEKNQRWDFSQFDVLAMDKRIFFAEGLGWSANDIMGLNKLRNSLKSSIYITENHTKVIRNLDHFSWKANQAIHFSLKITEVLELPVHFDKNVLFLDKKKLKGKLQGRMKMVGDKIAVIGMKGTQKVSKISKDAKLNQAEKANLIVVHDDQEIHWVYPLKIGRNALATVESKQILRVEIMISPDCPNSPNDF